MPLIPLAWQPVFALALPVFKVIQNNLYSWVLRERDDIKPRAIVFSIDFSNALFILYCMQISASLNTSILLISMDFLQLLVSTYDLNLMFNCIMDLTDKMDAGANQVVAKAMAILEAYPELAQERSRGSISASKAKALSTRFQRKFIVSFTQNEISGTSLTGPLKSTIKTKKLSSLSRGYIPPPLQELVLCSAGPSRKWSLPASTAGATCSIQILTVRERHSLLHRTLQILFLTEFVLLVKFVEVGYLIITYYFPNRKFYPGLQDTDERQFWRMIGYIMTYAGLESASFVLIVCMIHHTTYRFPLHVQHLAFVLKCERGKVQPKFALWVMLVVQAMIPHSGNVLVLPPDLGIGTHSSFAWFVVPVSVFIGYEGFKASPDPKPPFMSSPK